MIIDRLIGRLRAIEEHRLVDGPELFPNRTVGAQMWERALRGEHDPPTNVFFYQIIEGNKCWLIGRRGGRQHWRRGWYLFQHCRNTIAAIEVAHPTRPVKVYMISKIRVPVRKGCLPVRDR